MRTGVDGVGGRPRRWHARCVDGGIPRGHRAGARPAGLSRRPASRIPAENLALLCALAYRRGMRGEVLSAPAPSPFLRFAYDLGRSRATGVLAVGASDQALSLREGAVVVAEVDALGRRAAAELARIAALDGTTWSFRPGLVPAGGRLLPLARWVREHVERGLDVSTADRWTADLAGARVALRPGSGLDLALLDETDLRLVDALRRPRELRDLSSLARAPRFRLLAFVHFLYSIDALIVLRAGASPRAVAEPRRRPAPRTSGVVASSPPEATLPRVAALRLLGLPAHADAQRVKAAFRGLARRLHPDLHPGAGEQRRRELELRVAELTAQLDAWTGGRFSRLLAESPPSVRRQP